jgi:hypothetical protein
MPWLHRYIGNPLLTSMLNALFGLRISDAHCGMKAFSREAKDKMTLRSPGMEFASEIIIEAARKKLRIAEVPIEYRARGGGKAKLKSFQDGWRHMRFMLLYSPTTLFVAPGILLMAAGLMLLLLLMGGPLYIRNVGIDLHTMVLGNMLVIVGFQTLTLGMYAKIYAALNYGVEPGAVTKTLLKYESLDLGIIAGAVVFVCGLLLGLIIVAKWAEGGFGELSELRNAIMASTFAVLGIQMIFSSLFFSMLLMGRDH